MAKASGGAGLSFSSSPVPFVEVPLEVVLVEEMEVVEREVLDALPLVEDEETDTVEDEEDVVLLLVELSEGGGAPPPPVRIGSVMPLDPRSGLTLMKTVG